MNCLRCGKPMRMTEKETSSGRTMEEYVCDLCGACGWEDDMAARQFAARATEEAEAPGEEAGQIPQLPHSSLWNRLLARFGG